MYVDLYQVQSLIKLFTNEIFYRRKYPDLRYTKKSSRHRSVWVFIVYMYTPLDSKARLSNQYYCWITCRLA